MAEMENGPNLRGRNGLWPKWPVAEIFCGRNGLWLKWSVAEMVGAEKSVAEMS